MELLVQIERNNPSFSKDDLQDEFVHQLSMPRNQSLAEAAFQTVFSLNFGKLHTKRVKKSPTERAAARAKMDSVIKSARDTMTKYVVEVGFWDYPMPNGKRLHECTVKEAKALKPKIGGLLNVIDNLRGKPNDIIGEIYTKTQLKKLAKD
jgi:hypothetical protein